MSPGTIDKTYPQRPGAYGFEIGEAAVTRILGRLSGTQFTMKTICKKDSQEITESDRYVCCSQSCAD